MDGIKLTKDADALICVLYKEYLERRKDGKPKSNARCFGSSLWIHDTLVPKWSAEDVDETCRELCNNNLLNCFFANNSASETALTDQGIIYMERRFRNSIESVFSYLERLRSILPW